jgi:hypothetical protein
VSSGEGIPTFRKDRGAIDFGVKQSKNLLGELGPEDDRITVLRNVWNIFLLHCWLDHKMKAPKLFGP